MDSLRRCLGRRPRSADTTQQAETTEAEEAAVRFIEALCAGKYEAKIDYTKVRQNLNGDILSEQLETTLYPDDILLFAESNRNRTSHARYTPGTVPCF
jgi:hypothetical protein